MIRQLLAQVLVASFFVSTCLGSVTFPPTGMWSIAEETSFCDGSEYGCTDMEATGLPEGFSVTSGSPSWDNTVEPIAGLQDAIFTSPAVVSCLPGISVQSFWIKFRVNFKTLPTAISNFAAIISGGYERGSCLINTYGQLRCSAYGAAVSGTYINVNNQHVKIHVVNSDGTGNGVTTVYTSLDGVSWNLVSTSTGGTLITGLQGLRFKAEGSTVYSIDNISIYAED